MEYNHKDVEKFVQDLWARKRIAKKIVKVNGKKKKFYLLDGPPYVNGTPHVGHVKTTTFKDVWGRFKFMQGFSVWFQPGFDCGGLPIENAVEKKLGIKSKTDIEQEIGVDKFIDECKKFAKGNEPRWLNFYKKIGAWRGWLEPYLTSENYYLESGWWTIKRLYEKGLLVEGVKPGFWCPHCETVLSGYEVSDSYKDLEDPSIFVKFPVKGVKNEYLLVWTTTPWTLPANVAVCIHPDESYVKVKINNEKLILAEKRLKVLEGSEYKILERFSGKELEGMKYEPLLDVPLQHELEKNENAHQVVVSISIMKKRVASKIAAKKTVEAEEKFGHVVDMETGSGIVHIAPGHGDVDNKLGKHYNLPEPSPVDEKGMLTKDAGEFSGLFVKKADKMIIQYLDEKGLMFNSGKIIHSYPLCWRCKSPLIYRMSRQWFLKLDTLKEKLIKENKKIKWLPRFALERFENLIREAPDWAITRQRYWGIPLPVWICEKCGSKKVIGSADELRKNAKEKLSKDFDLHKNNVDNIHLKCACGSEMSRVKDIMDVWFDSGIAPWASLGYPHKNRKIFETLWPVDLVDESLDQIRGWFYSMMLCGMGTFEKKPFVVACLNGWTLDEKGEKMSKSLGNVIGAEDAYNELGADILRLYYCYDVAPWETQKFSMENAKELGKMLNILWNSYVYFKTYSGVKTGKAKLRIEDRWILSRLNTTVKSVTENMEKFNFHYAGREVLDFVVNDFSRTYIKLVRGRSDAGADYTLTNVIESVARLLAPLAPFVTEYIYFNVFKKSVHMQKWPKHDKTMIDARLEADMKITDEIVSCVNLVRKRENIKLRWPIASVSVESKMRDKELLEIIRNLCNAENVEFGKKNLPKMDFEHGSIYIDTTVEKDRALFRELTREIQKQRKERGLSVKDKIALYIDCREMKKFENEIKKKVGAKKIKFGTTDGTEIVFGELKTKFRFEKA